MSGTKWLFGYDPQIHRMCLPTLLLLSKLLEGIGNGLSLIHAQDNLKMIHLHLSSSATQQVSLLLSFSRNLLIYNCFITILRFIVGMEEYASAFRAPFTTSLVGHTLENAPESEHF